MVKGLMSANQAKAEGIDSTGTKAEEMKVSGKTAMKPSELAASGEETTKPSRAKIQEKAKPKSKRRTAPVRISSRLASKLKPMISPVTSRTTIDSRLVTTSARVRPASTAGRAIGSERK